MTKPPDLGSFAAHVEAATRGAGFEIEKRDGPDLYVVLHGQPMRCNLNQAYQVTTTCCSNMPFMVLYPHEISATARNRGRRTGL